VHRRGRALRLFPDPLRGRGAGMQVRLFPSWHSTDSTVPTVIPPEHPYGEDTPNTTRNP
jgi:hypothetical protein